MQKQFRTEPVKLAKLVSVKLDAISQAFYQFFSSPGSITTHNVYNQTGILQFMTQLPVRKTWTKPSNGEMGKPTMVCANKLTLGLEGPREQGL